MKRISPNWFIRYGWLTGKPDFNRIWKRDENGEAYPDDFIVISLCGAFWRAVRTTFVGLLFSAAISGIIYKAVTTPKEFFGVLFAAGFLVAAVMGIHTLIDKWKQRPKKDQPKKPSIVKDTLWAIKNKVCPVYEVEI